MSRERPLAGDSLAPWLRPDEQSVALAAGFRLIQRYRGHRYSSDDMLVAHRACTDGRPAPARVLDLGCGIGSVLLMAAWAWPEAVLTGVEAQPEHVALARRNVLLNGCEGRARVVSGDMRDEALLARLGTFELVTGTPPYFDPAASTVCADRQRACAHWELRGGIEDYARAAAACLAPSGRFVVCAGPTPPDRTERAFAAVGLRVDAWRAVLPRPDKPPFLLLLTGTRSPDEPTREEPPLTMREADGRRTLEHIQIRESFGVPCGPR